MDVISVIYWHMLVYWYQRLTMLIKWDDQTSEDIIINRGTRQGDISSTFLFNLMYQDMVDVI